MGCLPFSPIIFFAAPNPNVEMARFVGSAEALVVAISQVSSEDKAGLLKIKPTYQRMSSSLLESSGQPLDGEQKMWRRTLQKQQPLTAQERYWRNAESAIELMYFSRVAQLLNEMRNFS